MNEVMQVVKILLVRICRLFHIQRLKKSLISSEQQLRYHDLMDLHTLVKFTRKSICVTLSICHIISENMCFVQV